MRPFVLVSGNPGKIAETHRILGREIDSVDIDLPEIQSLDLLAVLEAKAEEAWKRVGRPLVVEETGLSLPALNGFPGPLVKWMLEAVAAEGIARTAIALGDPRATAVCALLYRDQSESITGYGETPGRLVLPARGEDGFGWDPVFQPDGFEKTYAELGTAEKDKSGHRGRAWADLLMKM